jgi:hypothetical protein
MYPRNNTIHLMGIQRIIFKIHPVYIRRHEYYVIRYSSTYKQNCAIT